MERNESYRRKLGVIAEELDGLPKRTESLNPLERRGVLNAVQVAVDAAMDVVAMRVRDLGRDVSDDYHNLETLREAGELDQALADGLRTLNGLRNAIVHKYNRFEEATVLEGLPEIRRTLTGFSDRVEATAVTSRPRLDAIRDALAPLMEFDVVVFGSALTDRFHARSDVDVAVITRRADHAENRALWQGLLGSVPDRFDLRVFELLPLPIQVDIANHHEVVFGDPVDLSYYFYAFRRRWKDQAPRHRANRFRSAGEKRAALRRARKTGSAASAR